MDARQPFEAVKPILRAAMLTGLPVVACVTHVDVAPTEDVDELLNRVGTFGLYNDVRAVPIHSYELDKMGARRDSTEMYGLRILEVATDSALRMAKKETG
jgi:hypothetical protein